MNAPHARFPRWDASACGHERLQPVAPICRHRVHSRQTVAFLVRSRFESVYNLAGGVDARSMEVDLAA